MLALRFAAVLALVFWIGGLAVLGAFVAPAAFDVLGSRGGDGRLLAGSVVGEVLRRFQTASYACGAVLAASLAVRAVLGPRPRWFAIRMATAIVMLAAAVYAGRFVGPRMVQLQEIAAVPPASRIAGDPRAAEFSRLHALSMSLHLVPIVGGLALLLLELKD